MTPGVRPAANARKSQRRGSALAAACAWLGLVGAASGHAAASEHHAEWQELVWTVTATTEGRSGPDGASQAVPAGGWHTLERVPRGVDLAIYAGSLASQLGGPGGASTRAVISESEILSTTIEPWNALADRLGLSGEEAFDRLFDGPVLLLVDDLDAEEPDWVLAFQMRNEVVSELPAAVDAVPRGLLERGVRLSVERGRYTLVLYPGGFAAEGGEGASTLILSPSDSVWHHPERDRAAQSNARGGAAASQCAATGLARALFPRRTEVAFAERGGELAAACGPGDVLVRVHTEAEDGGTASLVAMAIDQTETGWRGRAVGSPEAFGFGRDASARWSTAAVTSIGSGSVATVIGSAGAFGLTADGASHGGEGPARLAHDAMIAVIGQANPHAERVQSRRTFSPSDRMALSVHATDDSLMLTLGLEEAEGPRRRWSATAARTQPVGLISLDRSRASAFGLAMPNTVSQAARRVGEALVADRRAGGAEVELYAGGSVRPAILTELVGQSGPLSEPPLSAMRFINRITWAAARRNASGGAMAEVVFEIDLVPVPGD